jgi:hypothetical protein
LRGLQSAGYIEEMSVRETEISRDYEWDTKRFNIRRQITT